MTKRELLEALAAYPDDAPVVLSQDPEGNGFGLLVNVEPIDVAAVRASGAAMRAVPEDGEVVVLWPA